MKLKNIKNKLFPTTFLLIVSFFPLVVFGATPLEIQYPDLPGFSVSGGTNFFVYAFNFLIYVGGIVAIIAIIYQAISIAFSKGNIAKVTEAKDRIRAAFFGLAILLGSYLILMAINPDLTKIRLADVSWTNGIDWLPDTKIDPNVTYKEIPLGSIIESILIPTSTTEEQKYNYSQFYGKTEELCYLYDVEGNTLDRNNDGFINVKDTVEGLDMSVCMDNLLKAVIAKIKWFNGNESICNGDTSGTAGPINSMKASIRTGCRCLEKDGTDRCARWPDISYPPAPFSDPPYVRGCRTIDETVECTDADGNGYYVDKTTCDQQCKCCGKPRGEDSGCQDTPANPFYENNSSNYSVNDPCTTRPQIDCARQEMNFRIYGKGLDLGLKCAGVYDYSPDIAPFIDEDNNKLKISERTGADGQIYKAEFLTFQQIVNFGKTGGIITFKNDGRVAGFKKYFDARLNDLSAAIREINYDKNKNVLSFAEFQKLEETSQEAVGKELPFSSYDVITYHNFVCEKYQDDDPDNLCIQGGLQELKEDGYAFLLGEKYGGFETLGEGKAVMANMNIDSSAYIYDHQVDGWPFTAKRVWNNKLMASTIMERTTYNSGDPATLYVLSNPGTKDPSKYSAAAKKGIIDTSPTGAQCTLKGGEIEKTEEQQIQKGTLISNVPIGELAEKTFKYVNDLKLVLDGVVEEVKNTIESADQLANVLPEECKCSNCVNKDDCQPTTNITCETSTYCGPEGCTACQSQKATVCDQGCTDCSANERIDTLWYHCVVDWPGNVLLTGSWTSIRNSSFFSPGVLNPFWHNTCSLGSYASADYYNGVSQTEAILVNPSIGIVGPSGSGCSNCQISGNWFKSSVPSCQTKLGGGLDVSGNFVYGQVCTFTWIDQWLNDQTTYQQNLRDVFSGSICRCVQRHGQCYRSVLKFDPATSTYAYDMSLGSAGVAYGCKTSIFSASSLTDSIDKNDMNGCGYVVKGFPSSCFDTVRYNYYVGKSDNAWEIGCINNKAFFKPTKTLSASCGEIEELSEQDINDLKTLNPGLNWNGQGFDATKVTCDVFGGNWSSVTSYDPSSIIYNPMYYPGFTLPSGFNAFVVWDYDLEKMVIRVEKQVVVSGTTGTPAPKQDNQPYYVCPYNDIKKQQSLIYKKVSPTPSFLDIQGLGKNQSCTDDIPGFLQRIEVWRERLWDFQRGENLLPTDENRFSLLDTLSVARSRFNQCVQGYNNQYKESTNYAYIFTCEEGVTFQSLGTYLIYPKFPPYNSLLPSSAEVILDPTTAVPMGWQPQFECHPLNSRKLTQDQRSACYVNKDKTGADGCQEYIKNYLNDFYCCLGSQPGSIEGTQ